VLKCYHCCRSYKLLAACKCCWIFCPLPLHFDWSAVQYNRHFRILKMFATTGYLAAVECTKFDFCRGSAPDPSEELTVLPQTCRTDVMWCKVYTDTDKLNIPQSSTKKHANFLLFFSNVYPFPSLIDLWNIYCFSLVHSLLISTVVGRYLP